ncbi:uncharacterized protein LOC111729090 [Pteropus vampyrus]|uniref:Uncharacterized protein LOC111729090 n=1 Tax=Pteropus vampyrus TaxID=132908 RepID=A0A6P6BLA4_PTEVA|nr:uncharacterized protein LOC111729090 [Pteropus vampyrus]XP_023375846.1 uncharacterized protein LOC111729090 [Pteropus vampyrus]
MRFVAGPAHDGTAEECALLSQRTWGRTGLRQGQCWPDGPLLRTMGMSPQIPEPRFYWARGSVGRRGGRKHRKGQRPHAAASRGAPLHADPAPSRPRGAAPRPTAPASPGTHGWGMATRLHTSPLPLTCQKCSWHTPPGDTLSDARRALAPGGREGAGQGLPCPGKRGRAWGNSRQHHCSGHSGRAQERAFHVLVLHGSVPAAGTYIQGTRWDPADCPAGALHDRDRVPFGRRQPATAHTKAAVGRSRVSAAGVSGLGQQATQSRQHPASSPRPAGQTGRARYPRVRLQSAGPYGGWRLLPQVPRGQPAGRVEDPEGQAALAQRARPRGAEGPPPCPLPCTRSGGRGGFSRPFVSSAGTWPVM